MTITLALVTIIILLVIIFKMGVEFSVHEQEPKDLKPMDGTKKSYMIYTRPDRDKLKELD